jgi:hypothetical protein
MIVLLRLFLHILVSPFRAQAGLEAEISALRHQLNVLRRQAPSKPRLTVADRVIFVWLYRLFPSVLRAISVIEPETVIRWHRMGFRLYWRWKSRSRGGRPRAVADLEDFSPQSCGRRCRHGLPGRADSRLQVALRFRHSQAPTAATAITHGDDQSNGGVDRSSDHRSLPLG